jgi:membrane-associated phospholipid phosphatase
VFEAHGMRSASPYPRQPDTRSIILAAKQPGGPVIPVVRPRIVDRRARLTVWAIVVLGLLFVGLALALREAPGTTVDVAITHAVQSIDHPLFTELMVAVSVPGYWPWSWFVVGGAVVALLAGRFYREIPFVLATEGAGVMVASIKLLVERPRPGGDSIRVFSQVLDYSFPSGHVVGYVCLYGFLFFLVYVLFKRSWQRTAGLSLLALLVGFIGISRIHLGHHWASDVLGGYALGTAYLLLLVEVYRLLVTRPRADRQV